MIKISIWILAVLIGYGGFVYCVQRSVIFPRGYTGPAPVADKLPDGVERVWLRIDGNKVETWYLPPLTFPGDGKTPAVIFAHGNAELIDHCREEMLPFGAMGIGVLLVEYPGYGRSQGTPSQHSITAAFTGAHDLLISRNDVDPARIVYFGRSLGGGAVCSLAAEKPPAAMVLVSAFTSIQSMAAKYLVPAFLVRDPFDNLAVIGSFQNPVLIVHGKHDEIVPYRHAVDLQRAAVRGKLVTYDCGHNDCPPDQNLYWQEIKLFLTEAGIIP